MGTGCCRAARTSAEIVPGSLTACERRPRPGREGACCPAGGQLPGLLEQLPPGLAEVLEPFRRLDSSRNRETGGSGLGLALAKAIATAHNGRLTLANRSDGGLNASLWLPLS